MDHLAPGVHEAPNIQQSPEVYELENLGVDPEQKIEAAMQRIAPWQGKVMLDLGSGDGFHLPRFADLASHVFAVDPHGPSNLRAMDRMVSFGIENVSVVGGSAEHIPLRDSFVDIVHARFAYFFGPGCEPGLEELERVIRPGGTAFIIENDLDHGTFASWLRRIPEFAGIDARAYERFYTDRGFSIERIPSEWQFERRGDLESVIRLEFPEDLAEDLIREHDSTTVEYHYQLIYRTFGD